MPGTRGRHENTGKNNSMDNPDSAEVYRRMGISLENLIFKELVEENSTPTKKLTITIASYDEYH